MRAANWNARGPARPEYRVDAVRGLAEKQPGGRERRSPAGNRRADVRVQGGRVARQICDIEDVEPPFDPHLQRVLPSGPSRKRIHD